MDFKCIISKHINNKFCYIQYNDLELIMMKDNRFINATHLCLSGGKDFSTWLSLYTSKCLIDILSKTHFPWNIYVNESEGIIKEKSYDTDEYKEYNVIGLYVHYDLIPHIASWVFSSFAVDLSDIVNKYASNRYSIYRKTDEMFLNDIFEFIVDYELNTNE
ncbi:N1R/p28 family protein [Pigeonpox virus]|uniref:N1R/p28 family protein n=1 Tax=Pigeonpox virus TaxID=10264 RepID=A0A068EH32_9POXV|nr:N1R/p28 family protein [Pigeonpox virus]AID46668.1 N1R/p28 family protein [Pigeonpox virus]WCL40109.1 N1R/p28 family protein [Pigeonpox virus]